MPGRGAIGHAARQVLLAHRDEQLRIGLAALVEARGIGAIAHALAQQDEAVERRLDPPQLLIGNVGILLVADQIGQVRVLRGAHQAYRFVGNAALMDGEQARLLEVLQQKPDGTGGLELRVGQRALNLARKLTQRLERFSGPKASRTPMTPRLGTAGAPMAGRKHSAKYVRAMNSL